MTRPHDLTDSELVDLIHRVFGQHSEDQNMAILVDLPDAATADNADWLARRQLATSWARRLHALQAPLGLATDLIWYRNVQTNNADLPSEAWPTDAGSMPTDAGSLQTEVGQLPTDAEQLSNVPTTTMAEIFGDYSILVAMTEFSATAPLKLAAREYGFRAATMPGFHTDMVPALRLDYRLVDQRVRQLKELLDQADAAHICFLYEQQEYRLELDLRHRTGHASGGLVNEPGVAGNLPSGEAYIVPYEGELADQPSASSGLLPVELDGEVVIFRIEGNQAIEILTSGSVSQQQADWLRREPAYGNLAELGLGVLGEMGIEPIGEILLDEKLGLHIAFGRSDHFGGQVGAADFSSPQEVVHIDRVYVPHCQPQIRVPSVDLDIAGSRLALMRDGGYVHGWRN